MSQPISATDPYARLRAAVLDTEMAYVSTGAGDPVVFLHGNPTSSYLWRNVMPWVERDHRCLAPDLVGMGDSGKSPAGSYRFADHARYLDAWLDAVVPAGRIAMVVHDWGSALGFHWAHRHADRVRALVYMEALVRPVTWDEWPEAARRSFRPCAGPAARRWCSRRTSSSSASSPRSVLRGLTEAEMAVYRRPYRGARRVAPPDAHLAAGNPDRRRARRRRRRRRRLSRRWLAASDVPQALRQCRARAASSRALSASSAARGRISRRSP